MSGIFFYKEFNDHDLGNGESPLRKKFNAIIKDLEKNKLTHQGSIKLISSKGGIKYLRAKLSDSDRLLFTSIEHNGKDVFVILEVIPNHNYENSRFLKSTDKTKSIEIKETEEEAIEKSSDIVEIKDLERAHWLGKLVTFSAAQEDIVKRAEECKLPLVVSGAAGSGKTSVALESLKKIQENFKGGKILYITKSKNLVKESKKLLEYEYYDETAGEFKIGAPEEIEFLSLHEFLEKQAGDVKEKKPIDRSKFFSWFNKVCKKDKFKEYKKDGDKIFEEFTAVIGGSILSKEDSLKIGGKDLYVGLGQRESIFLKDKRESIYKFFEEYRKFIEEDSKYYDPNLIAHKCTEVKEYDAVIVDEVQDLTESTLGLILKSLKDDSKGNFLLCGDVNQVIHPSFFSVSRLKSFLNKDVGHNKGELRVCALEKNYRNSKQVIEFANRILHLKNYYFAPEDKITEKEKEFFFMKSDTENIGNVCFVTKDKERKIAEKASKSVKWAVLVLDDKSKEDARKLFDTPLVFNIHEAKGLEFENVILYKFTSHEAYNKVWNIVCSVKGKKEIDSTINQVRDSYNKKNVKTSRNKDKEDKSFKECKFYINALYVGVTRAMSSAYIIDDEKKCNLLKIIEPKEKGNVNIKKEESSPEEWRDMALKLIDEGNIEQAKNIAIEKLPDKKEYAEEIVDVLKARGYNKSEQTMRSSPESEIDIENLSSQSPQRRSMSESRTPAETGEHKDKKRTAKLDKNKAQEKRNKDQEKKLPKSNIDNKLKKIISRDQLYKFKEKVQQKHYSEEEMLSCAAQDGSLKIAKYLIGDGVDVNARAGDATPLHLAAQNGHYDVVKLLLQHKADVNAKITKIKMENFAPLHLAAKNGHDSVVELLLQHKADINAKGTDGYTPLHLAAQNGYVNTVKLLLDHGADVNVSAEDDNTPLCSAVKNGYYHVVELLLNDGASVHAKACGVTPLHLAAQKGHYHLVELFLNNGADVHAKSTETRTEGYTPLHFAADGGHDSVVEPLLQHKADINAKGTYGYTPLHVAAIGDHYKMVKFLLDYGAVVDAKGTYGCTPLHVAAHSGAENVVKLLLDYGADVNAKAENDTPLSAALENSHSEVVDLLLADHNINVGYIKIGSVSCKNEKDKEKFLRKLSQDNELFRNVEEAAKEVDENKVDKLLKGIKDLLKPESKYGFKPSLNYSRNDNNENMTIKIAIEAGGELLQLLYDYAEENIGVDSEIFKRLKYAKEHENTQPKGSFNDVSTPHNLAQAQVSQLHK